MQIRFLTLILFIGSLTQTLALSGPLDDRPPHKGHPETVETGSTVPSHPSSNSTLVESEPHLQQSLLIHTKDESQTPVSRTAFIDAIKNFENKYHVELQSVLNFDLKENAALRETFFNTPEIANYLSRDSSQVTFADNHPILVKNSEDKENSDYYEAQIYELAGRHIPYRGDYSTAKFYESYTDPSLAPLIGEHLKKQHPHLYIAEPKDICEVRNLVNQFENPNYILRPDLFESAKAIQQPFGLFPMATKNHVTVMILTFDQTKRKVLNAILLNSTEGEDYYKQMQRKWNAPSYTYYLKHHNSPEMIETAQNQAINMNTQEHDALPKKGNYIKINRYGSLVLEANRDIPLMNLAHLIQTDADDNNCAIYALNFLNAVADLLKTREETPEKNIYPIIEQVTHGTPKEKDKASHQLKFIFTEELKKYLPQYYDDNQKLRPKEFIQDYHLKQRWDLGSFFIKNFSQAQTLLKLEQPSFFH